MSMELRAWASSLKLKEGMAKDIARTGEIVACGASRSRVGA